MHEILLRRSGAQIFQPLRYPLRGFYKLYERAERLQAQSGRCFPDKGRAEEDTGKGRKEKEDKVYALYNEGIYYFASKNYDKAIEMWQESLKLDKHFDPAKTGIKTAMEYTKMLQDMGSISNSQQIK